MESVLQFENPRLLYLLILIPIFVVLYIVVVSIKKKKLYSFGDKELINKLMPSKSMGGSIFKFILFQLALASFIMGIARPQFGSQLKPIKRKGVEIIIALDVSNSMRATDIQPSRLERAKLAISKLIDKLKDDKIGVIIFAGDAYVQLPITADYGAAKMFLRTIQSNFVAKQGTAIGKAIELGMNSFTPDQEAGKAMIIITDGEDHEEGALEMAEKAEDKGIVIHTIGMGSPTGTPIKIRKPNGAVDFWKDKNNQVVMSKLNEDILTAIAQKGKGKYVLANNNNAGLNVIFEEVSKMNKVDIESKVYSNYDEKYQYFIAFAIFLLLVEVFILERKLKFWQNTSLFKINN